MFAQHIEARGKALFKQVCKWDMEGVVCKRKTGAYSHTAGWLKIMNPDYTQHEGRHEMFTKVRERRIRTLSTR
jgi:ATP-dependent DNA ligase